MLGKVQNVYIQLFACLLQFFLFLMLKVIQLSNYVPSLSFAETGHKMYYSSRWTVFYKETSQIVHLKTLMNLNISLAHKTHQPYQVLVCNGYQKWLITSLMGEQHMPESQSFQVSTQWLVKGSVHSKLKTQWKPFCLDMSL